MENNNIIQMDKELDYDSFSLSNPNGVQGGSYMTKITSNGNQGLFFQTPKLNTKQGIVITDKKSYFDIMIDRGDSELISWVENLEECLQKKIYEKRKIWFETELDMEDIQNTMTPLLRPFRGGKYHLLRVSVPSMKSMIGQSRCAIYDENENVIDAKSVSDDNKIICILEIQGIKFSSKYFQVDINARQIMTFKNEPMFKSCMIKRPTDASKLASTELSIDVDTDKIESKDEMIVVAGAEVLAGAEVAVTETLAGAEVAVTETLAESYISSSEPDAAVSDVVYNDIDIVGEAKPDTVIKLVVDDNYEPLSELDNVNITSNTLEEIDIDLETTKDEEILELKTKEFYYDIYRTAIEKAKKAKRQALESFLEAKKIRETYMLDEIENDSSDGEDLENSDYEEEYEQLF
tara:strand:- start:616 stop:1833 length:1218 start_codon:yes stop_codon:yes gene_type:complete